MLMAQRYVKNVKKTLNIYRITCNIYRNTCNKCLKSVIFKKMLLEQFIEAFGINPNTAKNQKSHRTIGIRANGRIKLN